MNIKKKKSLIIVLLEVIVGLGVLYGAICYIQKKEVDQALNHFQNYQGVWVDEEGKVEMKLHRMTAQNMVISIKFLENDFEFSLVSAGATALEKYEFLYSFTDEQEEKLALHEEANLYGLLVVKEGVISAQFSELWDNEQQCIENKEPNQQNQGNIYGPYEFSGNLTKKEDVEYEEVHLMDYMGNKKEVPDELLTYCNFERDEKGEIWRIHAVFEENTVESYGVDLCGISPICTVTDCEALLGKAVDEEVYKGDSLSRKRNVYFDEQYRYVIYFSNRGTVCQMEVCQRNRDGLTWKDNDYLMNGDTVVRYLGNYESDEAITLPENAKKIATKAFTLMEHDYYSKNLKEKKITIPKDIEIESGAFAGCTKLEIRFEAGRKVIESGAFANMVPMDEVKQKLEWVNVSIPSTVKKIESNAFSLMDGNADIEKFWKEISESEEFQKRIQDNLTLSSMRALERPLPIKVRFMGGVLTDKKYVRNNPESIGQNALWGCGCSEPFDVMKENGKCIDLDMGGDI